jgi:aryl-alcohol dehydrogenase-like predicted oxidoreductase
MQLVRTRRQMIAAASALFLGSACSRSPKPPAAGQPLPSGTMPQRTLGATGVSVSMVGLGGYHLGIPKAEAEAVRLIHMALDHGVTFLDNCWDYHDGESERRMGNALRDGRRGKVFLMTKLDGQTAAAATKQLEDSLRRLQTDHIDLVQMHEIIRPEDPANVFSRGAIEALLEAKKAGKLRFIGFTGHKDPSIHLAMLDEAERHGFTFDTVQMPINVLDPHFKSFERAVLPRLQAKKIGALGMKPLGAGEILKSGVATADECLRYAFGSGSDITITGCDSQGVLEQALRAALTFRPYDEGEKQALLARTVKAASAGEYEKFKTSAKHDTTKAHPEFLGLA